MKCNNKKIQEYKYIQAVKQKEQARKEYFDSLTEKEQRQFLKEEKERMEKSVKKFSNLLRFYEEIVEHKY